MAFFFVYFPCNLYKGLCEPWNFFSFKFSICTYIYFSNDSLILLVMGLIQKCEAVQVHVIYINWRLAHIIKSIQPKILGV